MNKNFNFVLHRYRVGVLVLFSFLLVFLAYKAWYSPATSISAEFVGYGIILHTNKLYGCIAISNTGGNTLFFEGVNGESAQMVKITSSNGLAQTNIWQCIQLPFYLAPGERREVAILIDNYGVWQTAFQFREKGFADSWDKLPAFFKRMPALQEWWTEPIEPPPTNQNFSSMIFPYSRFLGSE